MSNIPAKRGIIDIAAELEYLRDFDDPEALTEEFNRIQVTEQALHRKVDAYAFVIERAKSDAEMLDGVIKDLQAQKAALTNFASQLKMLVRTAMEMVKEDKLLGFYKKFQFQATRPTVEEISDVNEGYIGEKVFDVKVQIPATAKTPAHVEQLARRKYELNRNACVQIYKQHKEEVEEAAEHLHPDDAGARAEVVEKEMCKPFTITVDGIIIATVQEHQALYSRALSAKDRREHGQI